jgi:hypothetical protein
VYKLRRGEERREVRFSVASAVTASRPRHTRAYHASLLLAFIAAAPPRPKVA